MPRIQVATESNHAVEIHYQDFGSGTPAVLIHGWPLSGRSREAQTAALVAAGPAPGSTRPPQERACGGDGSRAPVRRRPVPRMLTHLECALEPQAALAVQPRIADSSAALLTDAPDAFVLAGASLAGLVVRADHTVAADRFRQMAARVGLGTGAAQAAAAAGQTSSLAWAS